MLGEAVDVVAARLPRGRRVADDPYPALLEVAISRCRAGFDPSTTRGPEKPAGTDTYAYASSTATKRASMQKARLESRALSFGSIAGELRISTP